MRFLELHVLVSEGQRKVKSQKYPTPRKLQNKNLLDISKSKAQTYQANGKQLSPDLVQAITYK